MVRKHWEAFIYSRRFWKSGKGVNLRKWGWKWKGLLLVVFFSLEEYWWLLVSRFPLLSMLCEWYEICSFGPSDGQWSKIEEGLAIVQNKTTNNSCRHQWGDLLRVLDFCTKYGFCEKVVWEKSRAVNPVPVFIRSLRWLSLSRIFHLNGFIQFHFDCCFVCCFVFRLPIDSRFVTRGALQLYQNRLDQSFKSSFVKSRFLCHSVTIHYRFV